MPRRKRAWYQKPLRIIALGSTLVLVIATVPPLLADPVPVRLAEEGQAYAAAHDWRSVAVEVGTVQMLGGLVHVEAQALAKNDTMGPAAAYTWGSVKLPAMLPREVVEARLREVALDQLQGEGIQLGAPTMEGLYADNGHDGTLVEYFGTTRGANIPGLEIDVQIAILTWQCSILGAYGIAFGVGKVHAHVNATEALDHFEGLLEDPQNPSIDPTALDDLVQPANGTAAARSPHLDEVVDHLMPHTVCSD